MNNNITPVVLKNITAEPEQGEPQLIRIRGQNQAVVHLDPVITNIDEKTQLINGNLQSVNIQSGTLFTNRFKRLAFNALGFYDCLQNVISGWNNEITFFSSDTASFHTVNVVPGRYETPAALMTALVTALNSVKVASGLNFTAMVSTNPAVSRVYDLSVDVGKSYYFDLTSPAIKYGRSLWNLPRDQSPSNSKKVGAIWLLYTRYIDFRSASLFKYTKNPNSSNAFGNNNIIYRFYLQPLPSAIVGQEPTLHVKYVNFDVTAPLTNVDIQLFDEFGNPLKIPTYAGGTDGAIFWNIILTTET